MSADTHLADQTYAERARLVAILDTLVPEQWDSPSLCAGWRVREVVAHLSMPYRSKALPMLAGIIRAGLSFDRYADRAAHADTATMSDEELLTLLRTNIRHPWQPPGGGAAGALSHDVIHGLDITQPLSLPGPPPERVALVIKNAGPRNLKHFGVDLQGRKLVATDSDCTIGNGSLLRMPTTDMLLVATRRRPLSDATSAGSAQRTP